MRPLLLLIVLMSAPQLADGPAELVGVWRLVSWQVIVGNEPAQDVFGSHPRNGTGPSNDATFESRATNCSSSRPQRRVSYSPARPTSAESYGKEKNDLTGR
jgi:hypothetical protein